MIPGCSIIALENLAGLINLICWDIQLQDTVKINVEIMNNFPFNY